LKKNRIFITFSAVLTVIIFIFLFYIIGILYFFFYTRNENINELIKKNFYIFDKYTPIIHHIRSNLEFINKIKKQDELIFDIYNEHGNKTILFQGDSWFEQAFSYKNLNENFFKEDINLKYINAGITSYSPSLMMLQLNILINDFKIFPYMVVIYIDQTDIYDEVCRYRFRKKYYNNLLISISEEKRPLSRHFYIPFTHEIHKARLDKEYNSIISKSHHNLVYEIESAFERIKNQIEINIFNKKKKELINNCKKKKNYYQFSADEIDYFEKELENYLNFIISKNIRKILLVTHFHKDHLEKTKNNEGNYTYISDVVDKILYKYKIIKHLNFSNVISNEEIELLKKESSWLKDNSHLSEYLHTHYFIKKIIEVVDILIKN